MFSGQFYLMMKNIPVEQMQMMPLNIVIDYNKKFAQTALKYKKRYRFSNRFSSLIAKPGYSQSTKISTSIHFSV